MKKYQWNALPQLRISNHSLQHVQNKTAVPHVHKKPVFTRSEDLALKTKESVQLKTKLKVNFQVTNAEMVRSIVFIEENIFLSVTKLWADGN